MTHTLKVFRIHKPKSNRVGYLFNFRSWSTFGPTRGNGFIREANLRRESAKAACARGAGLFNLIALKYLICKVARLNLMPRFIRPDKNHRRFCVLLGERAADPTRNPLSVSGQPER
jgi:hypothetical protein